VFGQTEGASTFKPASPGNSNWQYDAIIPSTFQGGSYSTDPVLNYLNIDPIPIAGMVPQDPTLAPAPVPAPILIGDMARVLRPGSLADSRSLIAAEYDNQAV